MLFSIYRVAKLEEGYDESYLPTGYEPKSYDLKEPHVESSAESLAHPQFSEQGFLEDVEYDDTALEEMLHNAHRVLSVSRRRPCPSERGDLLDQVVRSLTLETQKIRTLLDRQKEQILAEC